jgi:asparagine synthase (glutamine-hydrolysing)
MCGLAGVVDFEGLGDARGLLQRMAAFLSHRGPDATGFYLDRRAGLAHTRLSIIDLSGGDQPIHNETKTVWVIFNGEIFNFPELRKKLAEAGHRFYTRTDTEVLVHLYEEYGHEMFEWLNGQYAFAIWDLAKQRLLLGRDRVGIRPLFYYRIKKKILFGSEIKAIFADPGVPRQINSQTLSDIFTCWAPLDPETIFKNIHTVPPGHYLNFSPKGLSTHPYWRLSFSDSENAQREGQKKEHEWIEELYELLYDATRIRLRADVPVGAYLSGGLDSTLTSALVKSNFNNQLRTFSVSFSDRRFDETAYQQQAVEALHTEHRSICCSEADIGRHFPDVIWHSETPLLRTAPTPLYLLSRLVRENRFKVVLTGEGADEIFAGYNIFKEDRVRRFWARNPESYFRPMLLARLYPYIFSGGNDKSQTLLTNFFKIKLSEVKSPVYSHLLRWQNTSQMKNFLSAELYKQVGRVDQFIEKFVSKLPTDFMCWAPLSRAQYIEMTIFLSNYLLSSQGDRMAMAHAVEGRYPFLDHRVIELATKLPPELKLNGLNEKFILKKVALGFVPKALVQRPKQPYRAPIASCFLGSASFEYVDELLDEKLIRDYGYFDASKVNSLASKCRRLNGNIISERENMALVGILSTQLLHKQFIEEFPVHPIRMPNKIRVLTSGNSTDRLN